MMQPPISSTRPQTPPARAVTAAATRRGVRKHNCDGHAVAVGVDGATAAAVVEAGSSCANTKVRSSPACITNRADAPTAVSSQPMRNLRQSRRLGIRAE